MPRPPFGVDVLNGCPLIIHPSIADYDSYTHNESAHTARVASEILTVGYEDGTWSKPYYDCGGANIWMITYTVPFFGFNDTLGNYFFK